VDASILERSHAVSKGVEQQSNKKPHFVDRQMNEQTNGEQTHTDTKALLYPCVQITDKTKPTCVTALHMHIDWVKQPKGVVS